LWRWGWGWRGGDLGWWFAMIGAAADGDRQYDHGSARAVTD
jgi:hypothetical protein